MSKVGKPLDELTHNCSKKHKHRTNSKNLDVSLFIYNPYKTQAKKIFRRNQADQNIQNSFIPLIRDKFGLQKNPVTVKRHLGNKEKYEIYYYKGTYTAKLESAAALRCISKRMLLTKQTKNTV